MNEREFELGIDEVPHQLSPGEAVAMLRALVPAEAWQIDIEAAHITRDEILHAVLRGFAPEVVAASEELEDGRFWYS